MEEGGGRGCGECRDDVAAAFRCVFALTGRSTRRWVGLAKSEAENAADWLAEVGNVRAGRPVIGRTAPGIS